MEKLEKIAQKIKEIERNQPYDRRKKAYKEAEKQIEALESEANQVILGLAVKEMSALGYQFEIKDTSYVKDKAEYRTPDDFTLYIVPHFSYWGYNRNYKDQSTIEPYYAIQESLGHYARAIINSEEENFPTKVTELIEAKYREYLEKKKMQAKNDKNANGLFNLIKDKISYKSYSGIYERENAPWAGDKIQVKWESKTDWSDHVEVNFNFYNGNFRIDADLRTTVISAKDAKDFLGEFEKLVKKYTDYKRKKEDER